MTEENSRPRATLYVRAALYARVSWRTRQTPDNQLRELRTFCQRRGWEVVAEFVDRDTGASSGRPQLERMMAAAHRGEFNVLAIFALDRLTREGIEQTFAYIRQLKERGVELWSYKEPLFTTHGPAGELMVALAAWIADYERRRLRDRIVAGQQRAKSSGKSIGAPSRTDIDDKLLAKMREEGHSWSKIAEHTKIPKSTVIRRVKAGMRQA